MISLNTLKINEGSSCKNCNGSIWVSEGFNRFVCPRCNGSGVEPTVSPEQYKEASNTLLAFLILTNKDIFIYIPLEDFHLYVPSLLFYKDKYYYNGIRVKSSKIAKKPCLVKNGFRQYL